MLDKFSHTFWTNNFRFWFFYAYTAWNVSKYGAFSGLCFHVFGLNTEIYSVNLGIQSEYRKIRIWTLFTQCYSQRQQLEQCFPSPNLSMNAIAAQVTVVYKITKNQEPLKSGEKRNYKSIYYIKLSSCCHIWIILVVWSIPFFKLRYKERNYRKWKVRPPPLIDSKSPVDHPKTKLLQLF